MSLRFKPSPFKRSIYDLQRADYEEDLNNLQSAIKAKGFWYSSIKRPEDLVTGQRHKRSSTGIKDTEDKRLVYVVDKSKGYSPYESATFANYSWIDAQLSIERKVVQPFEKLIEQAVRRLRDPKVSTPKLYPFIKFNDFLVDENINEKTGNKFYETQLTKDYEPLITKSVKRSGGEIGDQEYSSWDYYTGDVYSYVYEELKSASGLPWTNFIGPSLDYMPDIYEAYRNPKTTAEKYINSYGRKSAIALYYFAFDGASDATMDMMMDGNLDPTISSGNTVRPEASLLRDLMVIYDRIAEDRLDADPRPPEVQSAQELIRSAEAQTLEAKSFKPMPNITNAPLILDALQRYMNESQKWEELNNDTKINRARYIKKCVEIIGNLPIDQIIPTHVRQIQKHFHDRINKNGKPTGRKTIMNYTSAMSNLLRFCKQDLWNQDVVPPQPYITFNYFSDVDMTGYGAKVRHYEALKPDQLEALFKLGMNKNSRLILCIAITTGMRMEEIIGLKHNQFKMGSRVGEEHIRYFDLSDSKTKNDRYAKRNVPLPEILEIPFKPDQKENTGMIFAEYERYLTADGKVSKRGTRVLNEGLVHKVRYNKDDDRKVFHSLRHNLAGFISNLDDPPVSQQQRDWIVGHDMRDAITEKEGAKSYNADPELTVKYDILQRVKHPYLAQ